MPKVHKDRITTKQQVDYMCGRVQAKLAQDPANAPLIKAQAYVESARAMLQDPRGDIQVAWNNLCLAEDCIADAN